MIKRIFPLFLLALAFGAEAATMRCGSSVISDGAEEYTVNRKCGEPVYTEWEVIEPWGLVKRAIYDMGRRKMTRIVIFSDGKVVDIRPGPRN